MFRHILILFLLFLPAGALGAEIHPAMDFAAHDGRILAALVCDIPAPYHTYAHTPGDAGKPTTFELEVEGLGSMPVWYPQGFMQRDIFDPNATVHTWSGEVGIFAALPDEARGQRWQGTLSMLLCSDRNCVPVRKNLSGRVPKNPPPLALATFKSQGEAALEQLDAAQEGSGAATLEEGAPPPPVEIAREEPARAKPAGEAPAAPGDMFDLAPRYAGEDLEVYSLSRALLFGLLAGLLLNAMPCVLPVLTFKISGLLLMGGVSDREKIRRLREHNLFFAAGILTLFTILALALGFFDMMWGQLYQSHIFLLAMLLLVFLMGISMLGVFHLPALDLRMDSKTSSPRLSSYLTGLVSTFLATPCSGPLLGGVLAWAFTQPLIVLMVVFWAVGLGMALPYLAICLNPGLARILPRPGAWMLIFEHILGFMLLGTALYLLSILPADLRFKTLCGLLACSIGAWAWGRFGTPQASRLRRRVFGGLFAALVCGAFVFILMPQEKGPNWQPLTQSVFAEELGKRPLLVEFTANWCPNCKFVEAATLTPENLARLAGRYAPLFLRVDLTDPNPFGEKLLERLGSKSIPLTALFPAGARAREPVVLRDIYGGTALFDAAARAFGAR